MLRRGAAQRRGGPARGVRGVRAAPAARPPVRRGRGHRPAARRAGALPVRPRRARLPARRAGSWTTTTLRYLESYRFGGDIWGYAEGDCYFPGSPILVVEGTFAEAVILETLGLSILNHDCAIASAASRMVTAADGRPLIEMGSRRTHELAAVASARAAYLAGFATTSNLRAGRDYGVPTSGTSAHAFTLVHDSERQAFARQLDALGTGTTLLVDTYDVPPGGARRGRARRARPRRGPDRQRRPARGGAPGPRAAGRARRDARPGSCSPATWTSTRSRRWPPRRSTATASAPPLVTGSGAPTAALVYKLVARAASRTGRRAAPGGQALGGQARARRAQVGGPAPRRCRDRTHRADQRRPPEPVPPPTARCCGSWCAAARSSAGSRWRRHGPGTGTALAELPAARAAAVPRLPGDPDGVRIGRRIGG